MIRLARPWIGDAELDAVRGVLESGMLVQGARVAELEERLAAHCGRRHAIACGSGTAALELALEALEIDSGEILCPDLSWPSPAHAILRRGATPHLVDVDPSSWNATARAMSDATNAQTRAAVLIDQFGMPADFEAVREALGDDLPILVDAACSLGAEIGGQCGGALGAVACLSFHPRKLITTGEGGACLTDDDDLADRIRMLRNHGIVGPGEFGAAAGNQRMTEMAAAMGIQQLARLPHILERRRALGRRYREAIDPAWVQQSPPTIETNFQTFGVVLPAKHDRDGVVANLRAQGIEAGRLSYAMHRIGSLDGRFRGGPFPEAERIADHGLALPLHPLLSDEDQARVIRAFEKEVT